MIIPNNELFKYEVNLPPESIIANLYGKAYLAGTKLINKCCSNARTKGIQ